MKSNHVFILTQERTKSTHQFIQLICGQKDNYFHTGFPTVFGECIFGEKQVFFRLGMVPFISTAYVRKNTGYAVGYREHISPRFYVIVFMLGIPAHFPEIS